MITAESIRAKAASRYESTLKKLLLGENPFPLRVPYKRPSRTGNPSLILKAKEVLRSQSKAALGFGPIVELDEANTRRFGAGALPGNINFISLEDFARYIGKKAETDRILHHASIVTSAFPQARHWTSTRLSLLSRADSATWKEIVAVVYYFIQHPKPWIYPRELPLLLPTKFLESNHTPVIELLMQVCPSALNQKYTNWADRLGLRSSSELVEGRFLDPMLAPHLPQHMLAPVKEWNRCDFVTPQWVLITENRTTLLTLPPLTGCLALLGKGYAVTRLAQFEKLRQCRTFYWGDLDQHGFEILASLRSYLPDTISCLMDDETLDTFKQQTHRESVEATLLQTFVEKHLTPEEQRLWRRCADNHLRLEQEQIPRSFVISRLECIAQTLHVMR